VNRWEIVTLKRRRRGALSRRSICVEADQLLVGRATDALVHLSDPRVHLHQATLSIEDGDVAITALHPGAVRLRGQSVDHARLRVGESVSIGPFRIDVESPSPDVQAAFLIELVEPLGDDLAGLKARSRLSLAEAGLGRRIPSYALLFLTVFGGIGAPTVALLAGGGRRGWSAASLAVWSTGALSSVHRHFGADCSACHVDVGSGVPDRACVRCHADQPGHADVAAGEHPLLEARCATCHEDHNGADLLTVAEDRFCTDCHGDPEAVGLDHAPATDFGAAHPPLRATVATAEDGRTSRVALTNTVARVERSNLTFSHAAHLDNDGTLSPDGVVRLDCDDCHRRRADQPRFDAVRFDVHCASCHPLGFEPSAPDREVPHGDAALAAMVAADFYRGAETPPATVSSRRIPGRPPADGDPARWGPSRVAETSSVAFGGATCGPCHEVHPDGDAWDVLPVRLGEAFLRHGTFDHDRHTVTACTTCHRARASETSADLLLPELAVCQACHGGDTSRDKVPSTCASCHDFHRPGVAAMVPR
jgi:predicted CXXCH cytochrome family protein